MAPTDLTGKSPTRARSGCPPSIGCASGSSRTAWRQPGAAIRLSAPSRASSMARRQPGSWLSPAAKRRRGARPGRYAGWQRRWSHSRLSRPSAGHPCGKHSKKCPQALAEGALGHPARGARRVRRRNGRYSGGVSAPLGRAAAAGLLRGGDQALGAGRPHATPGGPRTSRAYPPTRTNAMGQGIGS
jgi:hypothetical protein